MILLVGLIINQKDKKLHNLIMFDTLKNNL